MMPNLLNFFTSNGTFMSSNHTPLIAHTADDLLTTFIGLYGDREGMPISNSYQAYNTDGTTDPAASFAYWTDPIFDTAKTPNPGHDTNPGTADLTRDGYPVTNAVGNLVDLNGNQINGAFLTNHPGFPGFGGINASQTLAYMSDMLESGALADILVASSVCWPPQTAPCCSWSTCRSG